MIADQPAGVENALARLRKAGIEGQELEDAVKAAVESKNSSKLRVWARERGARLATGGSDLRAGVNEAMRVAEALPGLELTAELMSAMTEGYVAAKEAGDHWNDRIAELTALHRIMSAANSSLKLNDMLNETVTAVVAFTHGDICSVFLYEPEWDQLVLTATTGLNQSAVGKVRLQLGEGITGWAAMAGKPIAVKDAWADSRFKYVQALQEEDTVSMLAVPIVLFTIEKLVGVITIHTFEERDFSDTEIKFLETVAGEIAMAIENARLYEQTDTRLQQKVRELSTLQGVSAHIAATLNLPEVLALIAHQAAHLVHADAAAIYELHPDAGILDLVAEYDLQHPNHGRYRWQPGKRVALSVDSSAIAHAVEKGIPATLLPDSDAQLGLPYATDGYKSLFCVPLVAPRGIMGGICLYNKEETTFSEEQVSLLDAFGHEAAIALENSRLYDAALRGLKAKSAMLQEMNHRVRNNLQTVAGLLSMQLRRMEPSNEAAVAVRESIARIQSMAVVHDLMMRSDAEIDTTSIYEIARKVVDSVVSTLGRPDLKLKINVQPDEAEQIKVGSHEATLLALLFNELLSNIMLHGFAGRNTGEITVRAWKEQPGERAGKSMRLGGAAGQMPTIKIEVGDNGRGLPKGFDAQKDAHLGLSIVRTLVVSDLRGEFKIEANKKGKGTKALISFVPSSGV